MDMSLLPSDVASEPIVVERLGLVRVVVLVPRLTPFNRLFGEFILPCVGKADMFQILHQPVLKYLKVMGHVKAGVCDVLLLLLGVNKYTPGGKATPDHILWKVTGDPSWRRTGNEVNPGVHHAIITRHFG